MLLGNRFVWKCVYSRYWANQLNGARNLNTRIARTNLIDVGKCQILIRRGMCTNSNFY